jgi:hypothetical protein
MCCGEVLFCHAWCPGGFLYQNGHLFLEILEIFCCYFVDYNIYFIIDYFIGYDLFSFYDAPDFLVWSSDGVAGFSCIPFIYIYWF